MAPTSKQRADHRIVPPDVSKTHVKERQQEREDPKLALHEAGTELPARLPPRTATDDKLRDLVVSAHRFIAKTPSVLAAVRLADMTDEKHPTNIPAQAIAIRTGSRSVRTNGRPEDLPLLKEIARSNARRAIWRGMNDTSTDCLSELFLKPFAPSATNQHPDGVDR